MEGFLITLAKITDSIADVKCFSLRKKFPEKGVEEEIPSGKCIQSARGEPPFG